MADINGSNYNLEFVAEPSQQAAIGEYGGRKKIMYDEFSGAAGGDVVFFGKIPAGARILDLKNIGAGTAPVFNIAVGDKIASLQDITCTLDGDASAAGSVWVEYILD